MRSRLAIIAAVGMTALVVALAFAFSLVLNA
jgi:hypothetical protein